jgi:hypothetical protein
VPVGSYVIVTDTVVNGRPVWPGAWIRDHAERQEDLATRQLRRPLMEKYCRWFNPVLLGAG